jgi:uncharacterized protein YdeI (YjbR/CyaY-like superfamily)
MPDEIADRFESRFAGPATPNKSPPSDQNHYLTWIADAKKPATRQRRIAQK